MSRLLLFHLADTNKSVIISATQWPAEGWMLMYAHVEYLYTQEDTWSYTDHWQHLDVLTLTTWC